LALDLAEKVRTQRNAAPLNTQQYAPGRMPHSEKDSKLKENAYNILGELEKYNKMSPFDRLHNKRHDF